MNFFALIEAALRREEPFALGIIVEVKGSSPQKQGAKALFYADGRIDGTLGGGCLEAEVQKRARQALISRKPELFELVLDHDFGWDDGLICGGKVCGIILPDAPSAAALWSRLARRDETVTWGVRKDFKIEAARAEEDSDQDWCYQETVSPACALWIAGAGHVGRAVAALAARLDFDVTIFDDRPSLAQPRFFPAGTRFRVDYWEKMLTDAFPPKPVFGLIVTRGHQHDALALRHWLHRPFSFLGMIGSRRKKRLVFDQFLEEKIATEEQLAAVACPVGLELLAHTVDEIALSIVAQFVLQRGEKVYRRVGKGAVGGLTSTPALCCGA